MCSTGSEVTGGNPRIPKNEASQEPKKKNRMHILILGLNCYPRSSMHGLADGRTDGLTDELIQVGLGNLSTAPPGLTLQVNLGSSLMKTTSP